MTRWFAVLFASLAPLPAAAQQPTPMPRPAPTVTLSFNEALEQAKKNSPTYRQALNAADPAHWSVRNANGALIPQLSVGGGVGYTGSGSNQFNGTRFTATSPSYSSSYQVNLSWALSGATLANISQQKSALEAAQGDITGATNLLRFDVSTQFLTVLQAVAQSDVQRQNVIRNTDNLSLAQARYQVGSATLLDVRQSEVTRDQAEVALLRAIQTENEAKLELFRRIGIQLPAPVDQIQVADSFPVTEPTYQLEQLLAQASDLNPALRAVRAREQGASAGVRSAKSHYFPSLQFNANWFGFTQQFTNSDLLLASALGGAQGSAARCGFQNSIIRGLPAGQLPDQPNGGLVADCNATSGLTSAGTALAPAVRQSILDQNNVFPFSFTKQPFQAQLSISLPIFDGFNRELRVSQAHQLEDNASEDVRRQGLQVRTDVQSRWLGIQTAFKAIAVQLRAREAARGALRLAQDRYRLGSGNALELSDAQAKLAQAEGDYVNAIYDYHKTLAALEAVVGRTLR